MGGLQDLEWRSMGAGLAGPRLRLFLAGKEVARLWARMDNGAWFATLDMQRPWDQRTDRPCASEQAGRRGCEAWARRHLVRLQAEIGEARAADGPIAGRDASGS